MADLYKLERDAEAAANDRDVYPVENYGWLDSDTVDPEHLDFAMWRQDPPHDHDFEAWQDGTKPRREPTEQEQKLMELGSDFFGLMKAVRYAIGLALLHQPLLNPLRVDVTSFDIHEFTALASLRAAADHVRHFVIVMVFGQKTFEEGQLNRAYEVLCAEGLDTFVNRLREEMKATTFLREASNVALHGLATRPGHVLRVPTSHLGRADPATMRCRLLGKRFGPAA